MAKGYRRRTQWLAQGKPPTQPLPRLLIARAQRDDAAAQKKVQETWPEGIAHDLRNG